MPEPARGRRRHLVTALATAVVMVGAAAAALPDGAGPAPSLLEANEQLKGDLGLPHDDPAYLPPDHHSNPLTKNAVSRAGSAGAETADPTTAAQRRRGAAAVAQQRRLPDPELTSVPVLRERTLLPADRWAMANGCYLLQTSNGAVRRTPAGGYQVRGPRGGAARFYFKATDLGSYLLWGGRRGFLAATDGVADDRGPSVGAVWSITKAPRSRPGQGFQLRNGGRGLAVRGGTLQLGSSPTRFTLRRTTGCASYPEAQVDVDGKPHAGVSTFQEVRGYADAHTHHMAFEFLGGQAHCGRPWHPYGVVYALRDCPDHELTGGTGAVLETALSGKPTHDTTGWPTFKDWPAPDSLTHEGTYYRWMERSWRGGQRLFVNLLVENNKLCELYPLKRNSCDDMDSIRLQAKQMYAFERYVDAQFGGPGRGFYQIVRSPWEAREVINAGKMAVVMGIETSVPFGCTFKAVLGSDLPACTTSSIDRQLTEMHRLGVRQMELVNKFDNALGGVAGDTGSTGVAVNAANFLETGTFWDMKHCEPADGESSDRTQLGFPDVSAGQQDALFGAIGQLFGPVLPALPLYPTPLHCNSRGLTNLGAFTVRGLAKRKMMFDPDHLSVKARKAALDEVERMRYPGVLSSHSWSTPDAYPRIYKAGGFVAPYAGDSTGFVAKWRRHLGWADPRYYFGFGYGADINGLGAQGNPRGADVPNKVAYPFRGLGGVTVRKQRAGQRVYDINVDGVAQYGLYPDWIQDLTKVAGRQGAAIRDDMERGAEAYLQMWERAEGVRPDACRNPGLRRTVGAVQQRIRPGMSTRAVMRVLGQPYQRLGTTYTTCAKAPGRAKVTVRVDFTRGGKVRGLRIA
ncbi:hypothetical protein [Nocardioides nanhaiensis]|uniref:hypothetical protein n=1 Tax=Nocardioides nanhaiensis TaxID=1476871 RepID=UPI0031EF816B